MILSFSLVTITQPSVQRVSAQNTHTTVINNNTKINFLTFTNSTLGVSKISYPSYWKVSQVGNSIFFYSPLKKVGVNLMIIPNVNMSLDEFTSRQISSLEENANNFKINRSSTEEFLYSPAEKLVYTYGNGNNVSKIMQIWTMKDNKAYIATYFSEAILFDTFLPTVSNIINSIQVNIAAAATPSFELQTKVMIAGKTYPINYNITGDGNKLLNIGADLERTLLKVNIVSTNDGILTIGLPRTIIDSKLPNRNDDFYSVFLDGNQRTGFYEISNVQSRILTINFDRGTQQIIIQGNRMLEKTNTGR
jgi:hypothetical protein